MENNFCPNCGTPISDKNSNFCPNCGTPLRSTQNTMSNLASSIEEILRHDNNHTSNINTYDITNMLLKRFWKKYAFNGCDIYLWNKDRKSNEKIRSAINHYANIDSCSGEFPIACFDDTVSGNASDGALLSSHGVYVHNADEEIHFLPYRDITGVKYKPGIITKEIFLTRSICIKFSAVLEVNVRAFAEMIMECKRNLGDGFTI